MDGDREFCYFYTRLLKVKIINEVITSRSNPTVKRVASLSEKKGRIASSSFLAEGVKLTVEALSAGLPITHIIIAESKKAEAMGRISGYADGPMADAITVVVVSDNVFEKISTEKAPQGVISVIKHLDFFNNVDIIYKEEFLLAPNERAIILHSVRDPSNLGSVIRSAVAFGTEHIILSSDCADVYNPKTVRSAMGSLFKVKITCVKDIPSLITAAQACGRRVYAAELNERATSLDELELSSTDLVMIGNEGHGIPSDISAICDGSVYIPISEKTESLNASVAAAIFMWEQRK